MSEQEKHQLSDQEVIAVVEALLFSSEKPITIQELLKIITQELNETVTADGDISSQNLNDAENQDQKESNELDMADGQGSQDDQDNQIGNALQTDSGEHDDEEDQAPELVLKQEFAQTRIRQQIIQALETLQNAYQDSERIHGRGFEVIEIAGGWAIRTTQVAARFIRRYKNVKPQKLSRAAVECLAIIAYQQPVTRAQIDTVRGVDSSGVVKSLLDRQLVRILGRKDEPGRPLLYGTSQQFLSYFNLKGLGDLPTLRDLEELSATEPESLDASDENIERVPLAEFVQSLDIDQNHDDELMGDLDGLMKNLSKSKRKIKEVFEQEQSPDVPEGEQLQNESEDDSVLASEQQGVVDDEAEITS